MATEARTEQATSSGRLPEGELGSSYICDPANAATLREHTLDVSNTNMVSGTGRTPVKATISDQELAEVEKRRGPVVVAPDPSGLPENREFAGLSPGHTPEEMRAAHAASTESEPEPVAEPVV